MGPVTVETFNLSANDSLIEKIRDKKRRGAVRLVSEGSEVGGYLPPEEFKEYERQRALSRARQATEEIRGNVRAEGMSQSDIEDLIASL